MRCAWARRTSSRSRTAAACPSVVTRELRALSAGTRLVDHALLGARVPRTAAEFPRGLCRRHHARAGGHHRRRQPRVAGAVRLFGRRCAHRHAADGFVRTGNPSGAQRRARRLSAGQVDGSWTEGPSAAFGRLEPAAGADARRAPTTRTSRPRASAFRRATRRITTSRCSSPMRSRTTPRRASCSSAI